VGAAVVVAMLPVAVGAAGSSAGGRPLSVIVQAQPDALAAAARQVERFGGRVGRQLGIINGVGAVVPQRAVGQLAGSPAVRSVTDDQPVALQAAAYAPTSDAGSLSTTTVQTGAQAYWQAGYTGKGVDVA
jgi:serine protease AprX